MICPVPRLELDVLGSLDGITSMYELGNKANANGTYKAYFESLGIHHISIDLNGQDGALALDLTQPLQLEPFDMVTNFGTTEHVEDQKPVFENIHLMATKRMAHVVPMVGNWKGHGQWYVKRDFFEELAAQNGYTIISLDIRHPPRSVNRALVCCLLDRGSQADFMFENMPLVREDGGKVGNYAG